MVSGREWKFEGSTRDEKLVLILTMHVDDMAVACLRDDVDKLLVTLNTDFVTEVIGEISFLTGCAITQDSAKGTMKVSQRTFIDTLARRFDMTTTAPYPASPSANK